MFGAMELGNGEDIDLWNDWWCGDGPLGVKLSGLHVNSNMKVKDIIDANGTWNFNPISSIV